MARRDLDDANRVDYLRLQPKLNNASRMLAYKLAHDFINFGAGKRGRFGDVAA